MRKVLMQWRRVVLVCGVTAAAHCPAQSAARLAEEFVRAATTAGPSAAVPLYHPNEVTRLHDKVMLGVEREAETGGKSIRTALFGAGASLEDLRHMTHEAMLLAIIARLPSALAPYDDFKSLGEIKEGEMVHVPVRASLKKTERLKRRSIVSLVSALPYGKDWRAVVPAAIEVRIDDALAVGAEEPAAATLPIKPALKDPAWKELLMRGIATLQRGECARYFSEIMAPNFRASLAPKAFDTIVRGCENNQGTREKFRIGLELAQSRSPSIEAGGDRAVYNLSGEGLPYERLVLVRVAGRWYVAE
jgi:hypothetical protein